MNLSRNVWNSGSKRSDTDAVMKAKYDRAKDNDMQIIARVAELAEKYGVSMTEIALAWHKKSPPEKLKRG